MKPPALDGPITRQNSDAALRESQERYKFIFESVPVGIASHMVHPDGRVSREVNQAHLRICGLTREQHDEPGIYGRITHPEDSVRQDKFMQQVREGKIRQFSLEKRYVRLDGTTVWVVFSYQRQYYADGGWEELTTLVDITESKRAEEALRESEASYHSLVDQMPAGIFRKDKEGRFIFVNSWFCRMKGVNPEDFIGHRPRECTVQANGPAADKQLANNALLANAGEQHHAAIMQTGKRIVYDEKCYDAEGRISCFHVVKSPVFAPDGSIVGSQGILTDVTERRRAEEALRESEASYHSLVDQMPAGIFRKDKEGRYVFVNSWFCRFRNIKPEDFLGKLPLEVAAAMNDRQGPHPDARNLFAVGAKHHQSIVENGCQFQVEEKYQMPDGKTVYHHVIKSPVFGPDGSIVGSQGILMDISERKLAEEALAYERDLLRVLLDNSMDNIYFKDAGSRFIKCSSSQARQFGVPSADDLIGKSDFDFFTSEHAGPAYKDEQTIIRTGRPIIGKIECEHWKDGRKSSWVLTTKMPLRDKAGQTIGTFGISKDITAIKEAEMQLEAAHQKLIETSRLAGMAEVATSVLHNVGNVLNSVNVSTTLVMDMVRKSRLSNLGRLAGLIQEQRHDLAAFFNTDPRGKQLPEYLAGLAAHLQSEHAELINEMEQTRRNIDHIKDIVTMQQTYAKVAGVTEKVHVTDLVEDALRMNAGALTRHGVTAIRDYPAEPVECTVDRQKVLQILINLIRNSKYACDESGRADKCLTVRVRAGDGRVQIVVLDNGVGIPPENMIRIFNHGFTTRPHGHGFGLHSGALAAKELGGSLTAHSDGPGLGAKFVLEFPQRPATGA